MQIGGPVTAAGLKVMGLSTMKVFHGGVEVGFLTGARSESALLQHLERILEVR